MIARLAAAFGINLAALAGIFGLLAGAAGATYPAYKVGHWRGDSAGFARADKQAEINDARRQLAERDRDLAITRQAEADARETARANARSAVHNQELLDEYARELAARGPAAACRLDDADVFRMQRDRRSDAGAIRPAPAER